MSEKGWNLDEIPLEISENRVKKVCFCGEGPPDTNLVALRAPAGSSGDLFGPFEEGGRSTACGVRGGQTPGQGSKRSLMLVIF